MDTLLVLAKFFMTMFGSSVTKPANLGWFMNTFWIGVTNLLTLPGLWTLFWCSETLCDKPADLDRFMDTFRIKAKLPKRLFLTKEEFFMQQ